MSSPHNKKALGVCYYPEHWPEELWADDAKRMAALGLTIVRIGEFAWSRHEPGRGALSFDWLARAIDTLHTAGLQIVLGTPTATPPKWLVDEMPSMLAIDEQGRARKFGSRRHYCFSHQGYREECRRIVTALAERFGKHPGIVAWQTDNEYGCHDTVLSYSQSALVAFRNWLQEKYESIERLNEAWGNRFWSMEYNSFDAIELPNLTVAEPNPSHRIDFRRFASDEVVSFNQMQADILRVFSPGRDIVHNFMGRTLSFDHFKLGADLDISAWDSYPLGFLEDRSNADDDRKRIFLRAGDPDFQAFHHDLYRATSGGRWWVMEQQPGPVNWAQRNPTPRDGMVRLWTLEALAHGAETVSYFRWRQAPFAQEQMHSGLLRPDGGEAEAFTEIEKTARDISQIDWHETQRSEVAFVMDYPSAWAWEIQPHGREFDYFRLVFDFYRASRGIGHSIDFLSSETSDLSGYKLVIIPGLFCWTPELLRALLNFEGQVLIGPRAGSKTGDFAIPARMPPDLPSNLLDIKVSRVESLRPDCPVALDGGGRFQFWREFIDVGDLATVQLQTIDGMPALISHYRFNYLCGWPDPILAKRVLKELSGKCGIKGFELPDGIRLRRHGKHFFIFNYGDTNFDLGELEISGAHLIGDRLLEPSGVAVYRMSE